MNPVNSKVWGLISLLPLIALLLPTIFHVHTLTSDIGYDSYLILFMFFPALILLGLCSLAFAAFSWKLESTYRWVWAFSWLPLALLMLVFALLPEGGSSMFTILGFGAILPFLALPVHWYFHFRAPVAQ